VNFGVSHHKQLSTIGIEMDFTVTLGEDDWDPLKGGWRCPALQIPESEVSGIYVNGSLSDSKKYEINKDLHLIRWSTQSKPKQIAAHIKISKALSTQELTARWKKIAIILPIAGSLLTAIASEKLKSHPITPLPEVQKSEIGLVKFFKKSNDFLSGNDALNFEVLLQNTKREAWFVGTSFYISADMHREVIKKKLSEGVDVNFLVLDPDGGNIDHVAHIQNIGTKELSDQCHAGIRTFLKIKQETAGSNFPGHLNVRFANEELYSRIYFFDPKADDGQTYYVPQVNRIMSPGLPGFLLKNEIAKFHSIYFDGIQRLWNSSDTRTLDEWKVAHPEYR